MRKLFIISFLFFIGCNNNSFYAQTMKMREEEKNPCWACVLKPEGITVVVQHPTYRWHQNVDEMDEINKLKDIGCIDWHRERCN